MKRKNYIGMHMEIISYLMIYHMMNIGLEKIEKLQFQQENGWMLKYFGKEVQMVMEESG
jgi:hypothetical protein